MTATASEIERRDVGNAFLDALGTRDFERLEKVLGPTMRMRALMASGHHDYHGSKEVVEYFAESFGPGTNFQVDWSELGFMADRLYLRYRFSTGWPDDPNAYLVEQSAFAKVEDGRIVSMDLLCSGFRVVGSDGAGVAEQAVDLTGITRAAAPAAVSAT